MAPDANTRRRDDDEGLGVWTADDCALVLIDYQREMFEVIRSETGANAPNTVLGFAILVGLAVAGTGWALLGHRPTNPPQIA